jgi:transcriptional regulator with XRE-family HTH domain
MFRVMSKDPLLTQKSIADEAGIHPVTLSRILNGSGASNGTIRRISGVIGANAERIISIGRRTPKLSIKSIEDVILDERALNQFVGGADDVALSWARQQLGHIQQACKQRRAQQMRQES